MSRLLIAPFSALEDAVRRHRPSHLLTLLDQPFVPTPQTIQLDRHLRLRMHDIVEPIEGGIVPESSHVADLISFGKGWDRTAPFLVHCWAGISRSTAAAYILLCDLHGPGQEERIARALRFHAPHAQPNRLLVRHADLLLGRRGRMVAAVETMGEARLVSEGEVVELPLALDEL
jgi:predicted protein tyrosine phosphatase